MKKSFPYKIMATAALTAAVVVPGATFAAETNEVQLESGIYFHSQNGIGVYYTLIGWTDESLIKRGQLIQQYGSENMNIFEKNTKKVATLKAISDSGKPFLQAAKDYELGDIVGSYKKASNPDDIITIEDPAQDGLIVENVMAITNLVDVKGDQTLGFTVNNGQSVSIADLEAKGYKVEFQATANVFPNNSSKSTTGKLATTLSSNFKYVVVISKEGMAPIVSNEVEVKVSNFANIGAEAKGYTLKHADKEIKSGVLSIADGAYSLTSIKIVNKDGKETDINNFTGVTLKSSAQTVASISADGTITPISTGKTVITVEKDQAKLEIELEVVAEARKATTVTSSLSTVKIYSENTDGQTATLNIVDQFGDPVLNVDAQKLTIERAKNDKEEFMTQPSSLVEKNTDNDQYKGIYTLNITPIADRAGNGKVQIKDGDKALFTVNVEVSNDNTVASRKLELKNSADATELDLGALAIAANTNAKKVTLSFNEYNKDGYLIGQSPLSSYTLESSNEKVVKASKNVSDIEVTAQTETGSAIVSVKEGSIVRGQLTVTVVNSDPKVESVKFNEGLKVTFSTLSDNDILATSGIKLDKVLKTGQSVATKVVDKSVVYYVTDGTSDLMTLGTLNAVSSVKAKDGAAVGVKFNIVEGVPMLVSERDDNNFVKDDKGTIVLRYTLPNGTSAYATTTVDVNVTEAIAGNEAVISKDFKFAESVTTPVTVTGNNITVDLNEKTVDNLTVKGDNVTIKNGTVGTLTVEDTVKNITIEDVNVTTTLDLRGGGADSVNLKGATTVTSVEFNSTTPVTLKAVAVGDNKPKVKEVTIKVAPTTGEIKIDAPVTKVIVAATATNTRLAITQPVQNLVVDTKVTVTGADKVESATISVEGVTLDVQPKQVSASQPVVIGAITVSANDLQKATVDYLVADFAKIVFGGTTVSKADAEDRLGKEHGKNAFNTIKPLVSSLTVKVGEDAAKPVDITSYDTVNAAIKAELTALKATSNVVFTFTVGTDNAITGTTTVEVTVPAE